MARKTDRELGDIRKEIVANLSYEDFKWHDVDLAYERADGSAGSITLQVCAPVRKDGYWCPVTATETFSIARRFGWQPLTRAVADQAHNQAQQFEYRWQPDLLDFELYSQTLNDMYGPYYGTKLISGSHKLWVLSKFGNKKSVNYGFYMKNNSKTPQNAGPKLKDWRVKQSLGSAHDGGHWDYSQLLQLMKTEKPLMIDGQGYSLAMALVAGLEAVWDEPGVKLQNSDLP